MSTVSRIVFNPSCSIPHVHCCSTENSDEELRQIIRNAPDDWQVAEMNCLYVDGCLKALLSSIAEQFRKGKASNVDELCAVIQASADRKSTTKTLLVLYESYCLYKLPLNQLNAFMAISAINRNIRILTVSDQMWAATETTECVVGLRPIQVSLVKRIDAHEKQMIEALQTELPDVDVELVRLIVNGVLSHITDKKTILALIKLLLLRKDLKTPHDQMQYLTRLMKCQDLQMLILSNGSQTDQSDKSGVFLPRNLRFILFSAFVASQNAPNTDKRFFVKLHGREKRNEARERAADLADETGPRSVDVQRIWFICSVLMERYAEGDAISDILPQLRTLESIALIARTSCASNLDQPKYKCLISHDTATKIAKSLGIDITTYLDRN